MLFSATSTWTCLSLTRCLHGCYTHSHIRYKSYRLLQMLANAPKMWTDKLQQVLKAAARVLTETYKYNQGLTRILHSDLHWLDTPERIKYKLCLMVFKCLHGMAPIYLSELCIPVTQTEGRRQLCSAARDQFVVPRSRFSTYGKWAFACAGPSARM